MAFLKGVWYTGSGIGSLRLRAFSREPLRMQGRLPGWVQEFARRCRCISGYHCRQCAQIIFTPFLFPSTSLAKSLKYPELIAERLY